MGAVNVPEFETSFAFDETRIFGIALPPIYFLNFTIECKQVRDYKPNSVFIMFKWSATRRA